jgi:Arc/MetJ-type ribon-helix-helix transcriptional regulator
MRTTLTLDDDVAAILERLRKSRDASLKDLVNEALRRGLKDMTRRTKRRERLKTRSVALGRLRIANLDNIGEVLAVAEGEAQSDIDRC